jgi:hypothetical protein
MKALRLDAAWVKALRALDDLAAWDEDDRVRPAVDFTLDPGLLRAAQPRLARHALRFLFAQGGVDARTVLRDGRRVRGSLATPALNAGFDLAFTAATMRAWQLLVPLAPDASARLVRLAATAATRPGDWIILALIAHNRRRLGPSGDGLLPALLRLSPLAILLEAAPGPEPRTQIARLLAPGAVRVLECLGKRLAARWLEEIRAALALHQAAALGQRLDEIAAVLSAYLGALDQAERLDLADPVLRVLERLVLEDLADGGEEVRRRLGAQVGGPVRSVIDPIAAALARVLEVGQTAVRRRAELVAARYGDPRYEEAQLYLALIDALPPRWPRALRSLHAALSGAIG